MLALWHAIFDECTAVIAAQLTLAIHRLHQPDLLSLQDFTVFR